MVSKELVIELLGNMESDRIERTISIKEDKLGPAVCAFSNDFANNKKPALSGLFIISFIDRLTRSVNYHGFTFN